MAATTDPAARLDRRLAALGLVSFGLFVAVGVLVRADWAPLTGLDQRIANALHTAALDHPGHVTVEKAVSDVLSPAVLRIASVVVGVGLLLWRRAVDAAAVLVVAVLGSWPLSVVGKFVLDRDRPSFAHPVAHAAGQSYPSGHALTSFVAFVALLVVARGARRFLVAPCVLVIAAVGFSRLFLGVHYLTDVVGGWLLGVAELCLVLLVLRVRLRAA